MSDPIDTADPLALEPLTGSLSAAIAWFGKWQADAQLRFTTKFADQASFTMTYEVDGNNSVTVNTSVANAVAFNGKIDVTKIAADLTVQFS